MKRCNVCGNIGDDDCTVCSICGNPLTEADVIAEQDESPEPEPAAESEPDLTVTSEEFGDGAGLERRSSGMQEKAAPGWEASVPLTQDVEAPIREAEVSSAQTGAGKSEPFASDGESKTAALQQLDHAEPAGQPGGDQNLSGQPERAASAAQRPARPRRTRSGPQIYGQDSMSGYNGAQGVIRRDVQGGRVSDGVQGVSGIGPSVNRTGRDAGTSRRPERGASTSSQGQPPESGEMRPFRSEQANRSVNSQASAQSGPANAQPGTPVNRAMPAQGQAQRSGVPPYAQVSQGDRQQAIKITTARKVMETAADALASPMLIIIALFYTVYFVSNIAAIFLRQLNFSQIARLLAMFSFPSQLSGYLSMFQAAMTQLDQGALALNLLIRVPEFIFCIGLWLLIVLARSAGEQMSGAGFLLMRISVIITMIAACGILLVVLVLSVTLVIAAWSAGTQGVIVIAVATLVIAIAVTMAVLMYYFCYLATIKTVRVNAQTGEQYGKVSVYAAVIHIIFAFTGIINILSGIVNLEITGITCGVGQIGWMVLFGFWILRYRSSMSEYAE